jgi:hypothetical protein
MEILKWIGIGLLAVGFVLSVPLHLLDVGITTMTNGSSMLISITSEEGTPVQVIIVIWLLSVLAFVVGATCLAARLIVRKQASRPPS